MSDKLQCCYPCITGDHADDGTGQPCPCCGTYVPASGRGEVMAEEAD